MNKISFITSIFLSIVLSSCDMPSTSGTGKETISWQKLDSAGLSLEIPDNFQALSGEINPDAEFIYGNEMNETYMMVLKESIADVDESFAQLGVSRFAGGLPGYVEFVKDDLMAGNTDVGAFSSIGNLESEGLQGRLIEVEAKMENVPLYYAIGVIECSGSYYQVYCWTLSDNKEQHSEVLKKILLSVKKGNAAVVE